MSKWPGKTVIGLTGNIGTGKSVVRRMLEFLGAYGIDADMLAHRAIMKGAPGYQPVLNIFGKWVLNPDDQINRDRLGKIVFNNPSALAKLEGIIHPLVEYATDLLIQRAPKEIIVIEAIKLLESNLKEDCESIWVVYAKPEVQIERLMKQRNMSEEHARQRIAAQSPQTTKLKAADVVIKNSGTLEETWSQVSRAWNILINPAVATPTVEPSSTVSTTPQALPEESTPSITSEAVTVIRPAPELSARDVEKAIELEDISAEEIPTEELPYTVERCKPRQADKIAELINRVQPGANLEGINIMVAFGEKAFHALVEDEEYKGIIGWRVENLVARTIDLLLDPSVPPRQALPLLIVEMEAASRHLQGEASLIFVPQGLVDDPEFWAEFGYHPVMIEDLTVGAWREAARDSYVPDTTIYFKQLRQDRVMKPL